MTRFTLVQTATVALAPLLVIQGRVTRARTPRLPDAGGPCHGACGTGDGGLRLVIVGESPVAGVGHASHETTVSGQLGAALAQESGRPVTWLARGVTGARIAQFTQALQRDDFRECADAIVVGFGVNDTTALRSPSQYSRDLHTLITELRARVRTPTGDVLPVLVAGIPPLSRFPALPEPLRTVMGWRAGCLDDAAARVARELPRALHVPTPVRDDGDFASDGFHPGPVGCRDWARTLAPALWRLMGGTR